MIEGNVAQRSAIATIDKYKEREVLLKGVVRGAKVTKP